MTNLKKEGSESERSSLQVMMTRPNLLKKFERKGRMERPPEEIGSELKRYGLSKVKTLLLHQDGLQTLESAGWRISQRVAIQVIQIFSDHYSQQVLEDLERSGRLKHDAEVVNKQ